MSVAFGSGEVGMAEEFLDVSEVSTVLQQMGGERVAKHMDADLFLDAGTY
jgi:hypothetical protein